MPTHADVVRRIKAFNRGRDPRLLARKYATMRTSAFAFYRGTCHLFYEDWPRRSALNRAPLAWVSGDLHPENFGSYRGADGVVYFDVNDFDEAVLGNCLWDAVRCLAGIAIGSAEVGVLGEDTESLARRYLYAYRANLAGTPGVLDSDASRGMVHELLQAVRRRTEMKLVDHRTERKKKTRRILIDDAHAAKLSSDERAHAARIFETWNSARKRRARLELIDVAERLAGTGSMGLARYVALAEQSRKLVLFDLKLETAPSAKPLLSALQPTWACDAERVVVAQMRCQAVAPAPLAAIRDDKRSFVIKALSPTSDRVRWEAWHGKLDRLEHLTATLGQVTAWNHLRGAGKQGASPVKEFERFGADMTWSADAMEYARSYALQVRADYERFCHGYDAGRFGA